MAFNLAALAPLAGIGEGQADAEKLKEIQILNQLRQSQLQNLQQQQMTQQALEPLLGSGKLDQLIYGLGGGGAQPGPAPMPPPQPSMGPQPRMVADGGFGGGGVPQQEPLGGGGPAQMYRPMPQLAGAGGLGDAGMARQPSPTADMGMARQPPSTGDTGLLQPQLAGSSVDWQDESPQFRQRVSAMLQAAPPEVRNALSVESGFRTREQQAEIYERSGHGTKFMAAAPGSSWHERGGAADLTFKTPEAEKWVKANAGQFGLGFPLGSRDPNHMQMTDVPVSGRDAGGGGVDVAGAHSKVSSWWNQTASPQDKQLAQVGARQLMTPWVIANQGRFSLDAVGKMIEEELPGASPETKVGVFQSLVNLLHPLAKEQYTNIVDAMKFDIQEGRQERAEIRRAGHEEALEKHWLRTEGGAGGTGTIYETSEGPYRIPSRAGMPAEKVTGLPEGPITKPGTPRSTGPEGPYQDPETGKQFWLKKKGDPTSAVDIEGQPYKPSAVGRLGAQGRWDEDAMEALVAQSMSGDPAVMQRIPRSGPARQQYEETLAKHLKTMEGGIAGGTATMMMNRLRMHEAQSAATTAGRITMNTELWSKEAEGAGNEVLRASQAFSRTNFPKANAALAAYLTNTGDPAVIRFGGSINALLNSYGKMSNPTGTGIHDADKERLAAILDRNMAAGQVEAAVDQIKREGRVNSLAAENAQREVLQRIMPSGAGTYPQQHPAPTGDEPGAPVPGATQYGRPAAAPSSTGGVDVSTMTLQQIQALTKEDLKKMTDEQRERLNDRVKQLAPPTP